MRLSAQRRFQRRGAGRRGLLPDHHAQRRALLDRGGLSQAGAPARATCTWCRRRSRRGSCSTAAARPASSISWAARRARAHASAEVIVASGAFNSPQLLQLSGLGPADAAAIARHSGGRRHARRRRRAQRSLCRPHHPALQGADHAQRRGAQLAARRRGGAALRASRAAAISPSRRSRPAASCARIPSSETPDSQCSIALYSGDSIGGDAASVLRA